MQNDLHSVDFEAVEEEFDAIDDHADDDESAADPRRWFVHAGFGAGVVALIALIYSLY